MTGSPPGHVWLALLSIMREISKTSASSVCCLTSHTPTCQRDSNRPTPQQRHHGSKGRASLSRGTSSTDSALFLRRKGNSMRIDIGRMV